MKNSEIIGDFIYEGNLNNELRSNYNKVKELQAMVEQKEVEYFGIRKKVILNLKQKGLSVSEIASVFNLSEEEIVKILS
jgi:hypothetical protein